MDHQRRLLLPIIDGIAIAWTCVATDDPNPLHLDRNFAIHSAGYKDVVAPATMLTGWMGDFLVQWVGSPERVLEWRIRMTAPVWPGDQIELVGTVVDDEARQSALDAITCEVVATTVDSRLVAKALARLQPDGKRALLN